MSVRILLESQGLQPPQQLNALVRLTTFGAGETALSGASQAVALTFFANYLAAARNPPQDFKPFAKVPGKARLLPNGDVEFFSEGPVEALHGEEEGASRTLLTLIGATPNVVFEEVSMELPTPPADARFLEVGVELKVGETVEATVQQNDCLDLDAFRSVDIILKDEAGNPLPFERFVVKDATGVTIEGLLDDKGAALVSGLRSSQCVVEFPNSQRVDVVSSESA